MKSTAYPSLSAVEITETEDVNGLPILDQGKDRPNQPPV